MRGLPIIAAIGLLVACGPSGLPADSWEMSQEIPTTSGTPSPLSTFTPGPTITRSPSPSSSLPTETPMPVEVEVLYEQDDRYIYVDGDDLCLTSPVESPIYLTGAENLNEWQVSMSDDGEVVVVVRMLRIPDDEIDKSKPVFYEVEIWAVNCDGTDERLLVSAEDFSRLPLRQLATIPYQIVWLEGTHRFLYGTGGFGPGEDSNYDLHQVDADTGQQITILPPGQGGYVRLSPDGKMMAVLQPETVFIVDSDGTNRRGEFSYPHVYTYSEYWYVPQVVWMADSSAFLTVIPPHDPRLPDGEWSVWRVPANGSAPELVRTIRATPLYNMFPNVVLSPDLTHIAYVTQSADGEQLSDLHISTLDGQEDTIYYSGRFSFLRWEADGQHFVITSRSGRDDSPHRGALGEELQPLEPVLTPPLEPCQPQG